MLEVSGLQQSVDAARGAAARLARCTRTQKDSVLLALAELLERATDTVIRANREDVTRGEAAGMDPALIDRLLLTPDRLGAMAADVRRIAALPDPIGEEMDGSVLPNGLRISKRRVPLGVIGVIYEARPNVTIDVSTLCIKSGNAVVLRGGKESVRSNLALVELVDEALRECGLPEGAVQFIRDPDRDIVREMIRMRGQIDLIVPRGGASLIEFVREHATVPVVAGGVGVCHTYVHSDADSAKALEIVHNAKTRRPSICNALDTVLVHQSIATAFLPLLARRWAQVPVEMRCCERSYTILSVAADSGPLVRAQPGDFGQEFLALRAAIKVVDDLDAAVDHIRTYGSGHSEAIVTEGWSAAQEFVDQIDAAAVYVNASTQFTDGGQFGLGAELGISTQKFHARGPIGLREMTSYKWVVLGDGQTRA